MWGRSVDTVRVPLPGGRRLALRAAGGEVDAFVLDTINGPLPSARGTALLARCLEEGEPAARGLTVGDREALLLHLRKLSFGDTMECVLRCPAASCGEALEFTLHVSDLLVPPRDDARAAENLTVQAAGARFDVSFRLPNADDLDHAATLAPTDPGQAVRAFLDRCIVRAERDGSAIANNDLPADVCSAVGAAMAARDPQAEVQLVMRCPACGAEFSSLFDTAAFLLRELEERATRSLADVHMLALHYHWHEADILRMPARRRAQYIELVREATAHRRER